MTGAIEKASAQELAWNGKRVRLSIEQLSIALAPMFAAFPDLKMKPDTLNAYYMMLNDLDPHRLVLAVIAACQAHKYPTMLVTVAAIREAYQDNEQAPGPSSNIERPATGRTKMYQADADEDRRERMRVLRRTGGADA